MSIRTFALGVTLGFVVALVPSCGAPPKACGPSSCAGCCNAMGECVVAPSAVSCGGSGSACLQCLPGQQCLFAQCAGGNTGGGSGGGVTSGGSGGGGATGGGAATGGGGGVAGGGAGGGGVTGGGAGGGGVTGGGSGTAVPMRLFVTSIMMTGDFGGLMGGDARCNTAAQAANKGGTWKAWLSSSTEGAAARQADVGPWYQQQSDGGVLLTFNNKANLSTTPLTYIGLDEMGRNTSNQYWTGTSGGGTASSSTCLSWTDNGNSYTGTYGNGDTSTSWTSNFTTNCYNSKALLCIEQSHTPLAPAVPRTRKRLFITSVTTPGSFGGMTGGDARCNTAAQAANKGGTWKAWLSSSTEGAAARQADVGPWYQQQFDGGVLLTFNNKANLSTTPLTYIGLDEMGRNTSNQYWTGTSGGGTASSSTCLSWTDNGNSYTGTYGNGDTSTSWTSNFTTNCYNPKALLCIEQ